MKVKLLSRTTDALRTAYIAARTCYSEQTPYAMDFEIFNPQQMLELIDKVYQSGHLSIFEHINFTFAIEHISRACSHQMVRHRHCSFSQQSQRYVDMQSPVFLEPQMILHDREADSIYNNFLISVNEVYKKLRTLGIAPEDARCVLPNATATNMVVTMNCRELMHICNLRLCTRAQQEIRELVNKMKEVVVNECEWLKPYLVPKCEVDGFCRECKSCGRKPKLKELIKENKQ